MASCGSSTSSSGGATSWEESDSMSDADYTGGKLYSSSRSCTTTGLDKDSRKGRSVKQQGLARFVQVLTNKERRRDHDNILDAKEGLRTAEIQAADPAVRQRALQYARRIQQEFQAASKSYHEHRLKYLRNRLSHVRTKRATQLLHVKHVAAAPSRSKMLSGSQQAPVDNVEQQQQTRTGAAAAPPPPPSLPALAVIVKLLLQLAEAKTSPAVATQLRLQFLQQIKAATATAKQQQNSITVAAAVHAALPGLRSAIKQACWAAQQQQQLHISAATRVGGQEQQPFWQVPLSAAVVQTHQPALSAAAAATPRPPIGSSVLNPASAVEAAQLAAACEAQFLGLNLNSDTHPGAAITQQAAAKVQDCTGPNCFQMAGNKQLGDLIDMHSLLQAELALAMPDAGGVMCK